MSGGHVARLKPVTYALELPATPDITPASAARRQEMARLERLAQRRAVSRRSS
jgi:hypothetical protein